MSAPDVLARRSTCGRFVLVSGPHGRPVPAAIREHLKAPPFRADFDRVEKHWWLVAAAWPMFTQRLDTEGWRWQVLGPGEAPTVPGPMECRSCAHPYRPGTDPTGRICGECHEPLVLTMPPRATGTAGR